MSVLFLGHIYPEKVFSVGVGKISRNPILHQIEPKYVVMFHPWITLLDTEGNLNNTVSNSL